MQKLKTKNGNMMVEAIVSLFIISILIFTAYDVYSFSERIRSENKLKDDYINILDALSKEIIYNKDYHFLDGLLNDKRLYIPSECISLSAVKDNDINSLFTSTNPDIPPYITVNIEDGYIYKIRLSLIYKKYNGFGEIYSDLYKGKY